MSTNRIIAALDVGSFKVCCFIAQVREGGSIRVTGMSHQASAGIERGVVTDMKAAEAAISSAVHAAEQMAGTRVDEIAVSLTGGAPESAVIRRDTVVAGNAIKDIEVRRLLQECRLSVPLEGRSLIHAVPIGYSIDGSPMTSDPRGMHGQTLSVQMTAITASTGRIQTLLSCIANCHLQVSELVIAPYAAGLASLVEDERDLGATLIDMGAGTTSMAVFYEGATVYADVIPVGGGHVTRDIARGLSTPPQQAERLKTLYGSALRTANDDHEMIDVPALGEDRETPPNQVPRSYLNSIIAPRLEETFELVRERLEKSGVAGLAGQRVVLIGGASQLPGAQQLAAQILEKQVRLGRPLRIAGLAEATGGPAFATCAGLLAFVVDNRGEARRTAAERSPENGGFFSKMGGWFRENF